MVMERCCCWMYAWLVVVQLWTAGRRAHAEIFTSMVDMEKLMHAGQHIASAIDQHVSDERKRLATLDEYLAEYQKINEVLLSEGTTFLTNPLNAFHVIKSFTRDWLLMQQIMNGEDDISSNSEGQPPNESDGERGLLESSESGSNSNLPSSEDLEGAGLALLRLQDTYNYPTNQIASGYLGQIKGWKPFTADDCYILGGIAESNHDHYHMVLWFEESLNRLRNESHPSVSEDNVLRLLAQALLAQGNLERALLVAKQINPELPAAQEVIKRCEDEMIAAGVSPVKEDEPAPPLINIRANADNLRIYEIGCRGEFPFRPEVEAKLNCFYKSDAPFLRYAPFKVEPLHLQPNIYLMREVVSDREIEVIEDLAFQKLQRASVVDGKGGLIKTPSRVAKNAWLDEGEHEVISRVNRRLGLMTNLNMDTAEMLQIANYGLGGHYEPHFDMLMDGQTDVFMSSRGNRIATVLFYLKEPVAGGATVFPNINLTLFPSKHDAVFWHNLRRNGAPDFMTLHASCPVIAGHKTVANKWIRERQQEFLRPCIADQYAFS